MPLASASRPARRKNIPLMPAVFAIAAIALMAAARPALASTYAAYIPLDSSIYNELDTLNDMGLADSYLSEIQPISRVEAARITVEAEAKLSEMQDENPLARNIINTLRMQLPDEVQWIEQDREDNLPRCSIPSIESRPSTSCPRARGSSSRPAPKESTIRKEPRCCRTTTTCRPPRAAMKCCDGRDGQGSAVSSPATAKARWRVR